MTTNEMHIDATVRKHRRVDAADVLRGFAVLAIILLHSIEHFNFYSFPDTSSQSNFLNFCDKAIWDGLFFLFGGKAYAIFAMLFGFSFFIQHDNQRMRGKDFRLRFSWRLVILFLIGNFNAAFFTGEILVMYSLIGFVLVLTCKLPTKWIVALSAVCLLQPSCIYQIIRALCSDSYQIMSLDTAGDFRRSKHRRLLVYRQGQPLGRTAGIACLGLGAWPHIPDGRTLYGRYAYRASGMVP